MNPAVLDTSIVIDLLRGRDEAVTLVRGGQEPPSISIMTITELYSGVRKGAERKELERFVSFCSIIQLTEALARQAGLYRREYKNSHGVDAIDAIIAASCLSVDGTFYTLNARHFPMIENLVVPYPA